MAACCSEMFPSFYWPTGSNVKKGNALFSVTKLSFDFYLSVEV